VHVCVCVCVHVCIYMVYLSPGVIKKIHCDTLQHTATHYQNTLQQTEKNCSDWTLCVTWSYNKKEVITVTHCNTLQHTATLCVTWSYNKKIVFVGVEEFRDSLIVNCRIHLTVECLDE